MSDTCYMQVICRNEDRSEFEELGFTFQDFDYIYTDHLEALAEMVDEQANYAYGGEMPTNLVYVGYHDAGYEYGPEKFACDGKEYREIECSKDIDGFVIRFDEHGEPLPRDIDDVKEFLAFEALVLQMLREHNPHNHIPPVNSVLIEEKEQANA